LLCVVNVQDGVVNRLDAVLFILIYVVFTAYLVRLVRKQLTAREKEDLATEVRDLDPSAKTPGWFVSGMLLVAGIILLGLGAQSTVTGASQLARQWGMSERVIGLTIVSAGTGLPEVVASLVSALRGRSDVAIGNVIGSNLFNILIILGLSGIIVPLPVQPMIANSDCWWMLGSTAIILPIILNGHRIYRWEGFLLIAIYVAYIGLLLYKSPALPAETLHY
jgi:cation:H+ antiporter